ncbi:hypothetical protein FRC98_10220 [Lujinxingia vulgaris]|uniref:Uncharacterized protein n=1 Tax=Lujinxingia vulgaris TaxID=2600176 RepID=A0A5C6XE61_9DELT|nr:hypothetical protein [Lujinxingia vulgaris]TXD37103.1 hypothetical protein FRC98_10220 [Lujinxingia vulgaris]
MKRGIQLLIVALASAGLVFSGCDKPAEEPATTEEAAPEEPTEEEAAPEEEAAEEEAAEVNEDMYVNAAFEVTCVNAQIEDPARATEIKNEIYPRYGFTEESFNAAQEQMAERESVKMAIETRMEKCTAELAESLAEAGAAEGEEAAGEEAPAEEGAAAKKAPAKPMPAKTGSMNGNFGGGGFEGASIRMMVRPDFKVSGQVRGNREGAAFAIPFSGEVSTDGNISATGERDGNTVNVSGKLTASGAAGKIEGSVHQRDYSVNYNAN